MVKATLTLIFLTTYLLIIFLLPTPYDMIQGTFVLGLFIFPLAAIFYVGFIWLLTVGFWKTYEYMMEATDDVNDHLNTETISFLKKIPKYVYFIFMAVLIYLIFPSKEIVLKGRINSKIRYSVDVIYRATTDGPLCSNWNLFTGSHRKSKYNKYFPNIQDNEHYISVPIDKLFFSLCDYEVERIEMSMNGGKVLLFEGIDNLTYVNKHIKDAYLTNIKNIKLIKRDGNHYTVDIGIINHNRSNQSKWNERKKYILTPTQIEQKKLVKKAREELWSIQLLFNAFSKKNMRFPTKDEAKKLLSLEGDLTIYESYIQKELKENSYMHKQIKKRVYYVEGDSFISKYRTLFTFKNNTFVDPWGNPYRYNYIVGNYDKATLTAHIKARNNNKTKYPSGGSIITIPLKDF